MNSIAKNETSQDGRFCRKQAKRNLWIIFLAGRILKFLFLACLAAHFMYVIALKWVNPPITYTQFKSYLEGHDIKRIDVKFAEVSPEFKFALLISEDFRFLSHHGFNLENIIEAIQEKWQGKKLRGASTISQQTAKNVFLWPQRSWLRKGLEVYTTILIECFWGKRRILEVYMNVVEMGNGIFGIEAAAQEYFKKSARELSSSEGALLVSLLPNPKKYTLPPLSDAVRERYPWIIQRMENAWEKRPALMEFLSR